MIHLRLTSDDKLSVYDSDEFKFTPCERGLVYFLTDNKLTALDHITKARAIKLLRKSGHGEFADLIKYSGPMLAVLNDDTKTINAEIKRRGLPDVVDTVYELLRDRALHPSGSFDSAGRFYAANRQLINCRAPSRSWPYSEMIACRTKKYVSKCALFHNCINEQELQSVV